MKNKMKIALFKFVLSYFHVMKTSVSLAKMIRNMLAHSKIRADLIETCDMPPDTRSHAISALASVFTLKPAFPYGHNISSRIT